MPVFPQYNAAGPAQMNAPVMESGGSFRIDTGNEMAELGQLAGRLSNGIAQTPGVPSGLGVARNEGVQALGNAMFNLGQRIKVARDYTALEEAQTAIELEASAFEEWRAENPDQTQWESEWQKRASQFAGTYMEGKALSNDAKEQIGRNFSNYSQRHAARIGIDAVKVTSAKARESLMADILRAEDAGDVGRVSQLANFGKDQGWIGADDAVRLELNAVNSIETKALEQGRNEIETRLLNGDIEGARLTVQRMPLRDDEKTLQLAKIDNIHAVNVRTDELTDLAYESPIDLVRHLEAKDGNGQYLHDSTIRGQQREQLLKLGYQRHHEEREAALSQVLTDIESGAISSEDELKQGLWGTEASEAEMQALTGKLNGTFVENARAVQTLKGKVDSYDPKKDPYGVEASALKAEMLYSTNDQETRGKLFETFQRRMSGEPVTMLEKTKSEKFQQLNESAEATAKWKVSTKNIKPVETGTGTVYVDTAATIKEGEPGYFKDDGGVFGKTIKGRIVELSPEDALKVKAGKPAIVSDLLRMRDETRATDQIRETLEAEEAAGRITNSEEFDARYDELTRGRRAETAKSFLSGQITGGGLELPADSRGPENGLFPKMGNDPQSDLDWLNSIAP